MVVAPGEPGMPVTCWAITGITDKADEMHTSIPGTSERVVIANLPGLLVFDER